MTDPCSQVQSNRRISCLKMPEGPNMRLCDIRYMDKVAHTGSIGCLVVVTEDLKAIVPVRCGENKRDNVSFG